MQRIALITGITGQDGSYLAEMLLDKGYEVHGIVRQSSGNNCQRIQHLDGSLHLHPGDLIDQHSLTRLVADIHPDEVYNLAGPSSVTASWQQPILAGETTGLGAARLLEAVRFVDRQIRFFQASSHDMFGCVQESPICETTRPCPDSPHAIAKAYGHWMTASYRENYDLFACSGILFSHESPRRDTDSVTRKITQTVAKIRLGLATELRLDNLKARHDWGFAGDYVEAMWLMLQQETPSDFVIGMGETHEVAEFVSAAFGYVGLDWSDYVVVDPTQCHTADEDSLASDPTKARSELGWQPRVSFHELVEMMVDADIARLEQSPSVHRQVRRAA